MLFIDLDLIIGKFLKIMIEYETTTLLIRIVMLENAINLGGINLTQEKPKVLILGTFHMSEVEGLETNFRQQEIQELVSKVKEFKPTKIAVEMEPKDSATCDEQFRSYQKNSFVLPINEIYQLGFRLALELGHKKIFPTDWMGHADMSFGEVQNWAEKRQPKLLHDIFNSIEEYPELTKDKSVLDYYKELNEPELLDSIHKIHLNLARIGEFDNYVGINWVNWWYKRNLIMFSNLSQLVETNEERILFIVGIGHSTILSQFLIESEVFTVIDPLEYL